MDFPFSIFHLPFSIEDNFILKAREAVELALESGVPSKPHVLNLLARLLGESPPAPMAAPPGLALQIEPQANVERYDDLRSTRHAA